MDTTILNTVATAAGGGYAALLPAAVEIVKEAGRQVKACFSPDTRQEGRDGISGAIGAGDGVSLQILRTGLQRLRPGARWAEEADSGALPPGEWWVADPVEGAINHVHGMTDWGVTATLVRDNAPVLAVVHLPLTGDTYTAVHGGGAHLDSKRLRPSAKTDLKAALVGTGQALPGEGSAVYRRVGQSVTAMLEAALVVQVSVPATLQLIQVAAGRRDVFWQFSQVRSGLMAGALLVKEAGGAVTDIQGRPWTLASPDFLAAAPGLSAAAAQVLSAAAA